MGGRVWLRVGAISGFLAVAMGAFGAHGLKERLEELGMSQNYETAARYQMYHALAMVAVGLVATSRQGRALAVAGWTFLIGTVLFSGSLYALALSGQKWLGAITPFGGVGFLLGWVAFALASPGPPES
jgi:uncharacterized membrane protein YgdD (TMEM256/DUF423 family)